MKVKTVRAWVSNVPDEDAAAGWHTRCALHPRSQHVRFRPKVGHSSSGSCMTGLPRKAEVSARSCYVAEVP
jgi:hypothetical protein